MLQTSRSDPFPTTCHKTQPFRLKNQSVNCRDRTGVVDTPGRDGLDSKNSKGPLRQSPRGGLPGDVLMVRSDSLRWGAAILVLAFLFLATAGGKGMAISARVPKAPPLFSFLAVPDGIATSIGSERPLPLLASEALSHFSDLSSGTVPPGPPEEDGDLLCHHAYSGPLPSWECHHSDPALFLSPHYAPAALTEFPIFPGGTETTLGRNALFQPLPSPSIASPEPPPRHAFSL